MTVDARTQAITTAMATDSLMSVGFKLLSSGTDVVMTSSLSSTRHFGSFAEIIFTLLSAY